MARKSHDKTRAALKAYGLAFPGAHSKSPWPEHDDLAVKDKTFAFMSVPGVPLSMSVKLPVSREAALKFPFAQPTGYGLGKSGWVSMNFAEHELPSVDTFKRWILESYRAVAPKKLIAELEARQPWTRLGEPG